MRLSLCHFVVSGVMSPAKNSSNGYDVITPLIREESHFTDSSSTVLVFLYNL